MNANKEFEDLNLTNGIVQQIGIHPEKKITITVIIRNEEEDGDVHRTYELFFSKVLDFKLDLTFLPNLKIEKQTINLSSTYLQDVVSKPLEISSKYDLGKIRHFNIVFNEGELDVLSEEFVPMLLSEV